MRLQAALSHPSSVKALLVRLQAALPDASSAKALLVRLQAALPHASSAKAILQQLLPHYCRSREQPRDPTWKRALRL